VVNGESGINYNPRKIIAAISLAALFFKYRTERKIREQYKLLEQKILSKEGLHTGEELAKGKENYKLDIEQKIVDDILLKLEDFEENRGFIESGLTLHKLAFRFETNYNYLSQVVNAYRGVNFTKYLSEMRIGFITDKLYKDRKYLHYKIKTLGEECGMASRTNFSNLFQEINGIRPTDFIKKRLEDIAEGKDAID
jgi:YesN/AraC family two-component response regulator